MGKAITFPDRGREARDSIGRRFEAMIGKGRRYHSGAVMAGVCNSPEAGRIEGALWQTFCGVALAFVAFDPALQATAEKYSDWPEWREAKEGEPCGRCCSSMTALMLGRRSRFLPASRAARKPRAGSVPSVEGRREKRRRRQFMDVLADALETTPGEVRRRGLIEGRRGGRAVFYLGPEDGSLGPKGAA